MSFDSSSDGKLNKSEFKIMLKESGEKKTVNEIESLVSIIFPVQD